MQTHVMQANINAAEQDTTDLYARPNNGWRSGLTPLWAGEWRRWWRPRNALSSAVIWLLLCYGFNLMTMVSSRMNVEVQAELAAEMGLRNVDDMLMVGSIMMLFFTTVGAVVAGQDKLIAERQTGIMANILARPVTRNAYLLSKYAALPGMLLTMVLLPFALVVPTAAFFFEAIPSVAVIVTLLLLLLAAVTAFYALTLLLGTLFERRAPVLGLGLFASFMLVQAFPQILGMAATPIVALVGTTVFLILAALFLAISIQRLNRVELR